jgi:O-antigen/teichoic acid export membrane protein
MLPLGSAGLIMVENKGTPSRADIGSEPEEAVLTELVSRLTSDSLKYLPSVVLPALASVAGVALFTRIFAAGPFGEYSLVYAVVSTVHTILSGWLHQGILRYLPRYRAEDRVEEFLAKFGALLVACTLVLVLVMVAGYPFRSVFGGYARYYAVGMVWVASGFVFFVLSHALQATFQPGAYSRYQVGYALGRLVLPVVYFYAVSPDIIGLMIGSAAAGVVLLWPMTVELGLVRGVKRWGLPFDLALLKKLGSYGIPVAGTVLAVKVLDASDRFVIEYFRGAEEVGIYSANYTLVTMGVIFVATPLLSAAVPLIMDAWESGHRERIHRVISTFSRYYLLTSVPVVAFSTVFARQIAALFLGESFRRGYTIIPWVLFGVFLWNFAMYGHKGLKLREKTGVMFVLVAVCCVVNFLLNLVLVPKYGYNGAAVSTFVGYALYPVLVHWVTRRYLAWSIPWGSAARIAAAGLAGSFAWWGCREVLAETIHVGLVLLVSLVVGSAVYVAALALFRELRGSELRLLRPWRRGK